MIADNAQSLVASSTAFAEHMLLIQDKSRKFSPLRYNRAQLHYLENRTSRDLILKARQLGFSTMIQAEMFRLYTTGSEAMLTMADKDENTAKLRRMANRFYDNLPPNVPKPVRSEANASVTTYPIIGSEVQISTAGAQTAGRGGTYTLFHGSEVAFWKDGDTTIAGALQAVPEHLSDTWVVFESTANGASGWFYNECKAALRGESDWKLHFYAWWWDDAYRIPVYDGETLEYTSEELDLIEAHGLDASQIKWRRKKQRDLKERFQQEYPESPQQAFLTSGGGVFVITDAILYRGDVPRIEVHNGMQITYYMQSPNDSAIYVAGIDWGQQDDYTTLSVFEVPTDGKPMREVYLNRWHKQSWHSMRAEIVQVLKVYRVEKVIAEANSMGTSQIEDLVNDIEEARLECAVQSFYTSNKSKHNAVVNLKNAMAESGLKLLDVDYATAEMNDYQTKQTSTGLWSYGHPNEDGAHDDTVDARLLANHNAQSLWI